jgi:hypothetical protein
MSDKEIGSGERHQATRGGEHIMIRRAEPNDKTLYSDFVRDVSAEDLRLRFFARNSIMEYFGPFTVSLFYFNASHEIQ